MNDTPCHRRVRSAICSPSCISIFILSSFYFCEFRPIIVKRTHLPKTPKRNAKKKVGGIFRRDARTGPSSALAKNRKGACCRMKSTQHNLERCRKLFKDYPDMMTVSQLCTKLKFRRQTSIMRRIQQKRIPCYKDGRQYMVPKEWAIQYVLSKDFDKNRQQLFVSSQNGT